MNGTDAREWVDYEIPMPWGKVSGKYYISHDINQYQIVQQHMEIDLDLYRMRNFFEYDYIDCKMLS